VAALIFQKIRQNSPKACPELGLGHKGKAGLNVLVDDP
jgi:hypothetical protein